MLANNNFRKFDALSRFTRNSAWRHNAGQVHIVCQSTETRL